MRCRISGMLYSGVDFQSFVRRKTDTKVEWKSNNWNSVLPECPVCSLLSMFAHTPQIHQKVQL